MQIDKSYRRNLHFKIEEHVPQNVISSRNKKKDWKFGYCEEYDIVIISKDGTIGQILNINDLLIALPSVPSDIRNVKLKDKDQKWTRYEVPYELVNYDKLYSEEENSTQVLNNIFNKHNEFIKSDFNRIEFGEWFMNDGEPMYITGHHYFFLQHYKLTENIAYPDFRVPQRDYFLWVEACIADNRCIGSLLLKNRRSAFSTSSSSILIARAIRTKNGFFPIMSKKNEDALELFEKHIVQPITELPKHLQPQRSGEQKPKKEIIFSSPKKKLTTNNKSNSELDGLNTKIKTYTTTPSSYDGTRVRFFSLNDEIGKLVFDVKEWWNQYHKRCHLIGGSIVGKAICGSTAAPPNEGGLNYEKFYNDSKLSSRGPNGMTKTGLYAIFIPADLAYMGFFDEWGYAINENPNHPIKNELGEIKTIGAKQFLDDLEAACGDNIKDINYQKRNDPRKDTDAFLDEGASAMFATTGLVNLKNFLKEYKKTNDYKMKVIRFNLRWKDGIIDGEVVREINPKGKFQGCWQPPKELLNQYTLRDGKKYPINSELGAFGCDPYDTDRVRFGTGSKMGFVGLTRDNDLRLSEWERNLMFIQYNHRPKTIDEAEEDIIMALRYFSMPILPEINRDSLIKKLISRGYKGYVLKNPLKNKSEYTDKEERFGGIHSHETNIKKQYSAIENYLCQNLPDKIDERNIKIYFEDVLEELEVYDHKDRQKRDRVVALGYSVLATNNKYKPKENPTTANTTINFKEIFSLT